MSPAPALQLPLLPPGLQQMHQLLQVSCDWLVADNTRLSLVQSSPFSSLQPAQLQQLVQHGADAGRKQLEQLVPQLQVSCDWLMELPILTSDWLLQEQLQVNFVQQTHLLQSDRAKSSPALHQLQLQQQQLISQLQLVQQRLIMVSSRDTDWQNIFVFS